MAPSPCHNLPHSDTGRLGSRCHVGPRSYLGWGKSHALGTGFGLIIGAELAAPDKFCVNFMSDAAFDMTA